MSEKFQKAGIEGQGWRERDWDKLLSGIEENTVIPIIGRDLLEVQPRDTTEPVYLYPYIAEKLIQEYAAKTPAFNTSLTLSDAVSCCLNYSADCNHTDCSDIRRSIIGILKNAAFSPPEALMNLAEITDFKLYVTTTFDPLMEQALAAVRVARGFSALEVRAYDPKEPLQNEDIDYSGKTPNQTVLFHLMGMLRRSSDNVVVSEEDLLEFVCALHSENRIPKKLFDEIQNKDILLLGCSFSDWLARFFLRAAKRRRLSESRTVVEFVVDDCTMKDENLVLFLQHFSRSTRFYRTGDAIAFTKELRDRWLKRNPEKVIPERSSVEMPPRSDPPGEMPPGAIFLSYASEDLAQVQVLKAHLDSFGLPVWFDKSELRSGDSYESKILRCIKSCSLFIPVISARTENRREGFFRWEWRQAVRRKDEMDDSVKFILPVVLDGTRQDTAKVPDCFTDLHWESCPGGIVKPAFGNLLVELMSPDGFEQTAQETYSVA